MRATSLVLLFLACFVSVVFCQSLSGSRVLVVVESGQVDGVKKMNSIFWKTLTSEKFTLDFQEITNNELALFKYGERSYDHLIVWIPELQKWSPKFNSAKVIEFVNAKGNLLLVTSSKLGAPVRELAYEFGVQFDDPNTFSIDHFNFHSSLDGGNHTVVVASDLSSLDSVVDALSFKPVLYQGVAHKFTPENTLATRLLQGSSTGYSWFPVVDGPTKSGANTAISAHDVGLVSILEAKNEARIAIAGSVDLFSDEFIDATVSNAGSGEERSGNLYFVTELSAWTFKLKSSLRLSRVFHHKKGETIQKSFYRIKDPIVFGVEIEEYRRGQWTPFAIPSNDQIQLEMIMLDPHVRVNLAHNLKNRTVSQYLTPESLLVPDVYGVFTFLLSYQRHGLTHLLHKDVVSIRPYRHNEYARYLSAAFPYYTGMISMMAGFLVFSMVWLTFPSFTKQKSS